MRQEAIALGYAVELVAWTMMGGWLGYQAWRNHYEHKAFRPIAFSLAILAGWQVFKVGLRLYARILYMTTEELVILSYPYVIASFGTAIAVLYFYQTFRKARCD